MKNRFAFKMKVFAGKENEYRNRNDSFWPELVLLFVESGISNYSVFLDEHTNLLFGVFDFENKEAMDNLRSSPIMEKWWEYMKDIIETNEGNRPMSIPLKEVFYLP